MIIKTENSELEISIGTDVYLGSRTSEQIFKKWDDFEDNQKVRLEIILNKIEELISESKKMLLEVGAMNHKGAGTPLSMNLVSN